MYTINHVSVFNYAFSMIFLFVLLEFTNSTFIKSVPVKNICVTEICNTTGLEILDSMNPKVSPCRNFYKYICGRYSERRKINSNDMVDIPDEINYHNSKKINFILENFKSLKFSKNLQIETLRLPSKLYDLCIDQRNLTEKTIQSVTDIVRELEHLSETTKKNFWEIIIGKIFKMGFTFPIFFNLDIVTNPRNENENIIRLNKITDDTRQFDESCKLKIPNTNVSYKFEFHSWLIDGECEEENPTIMTIEDMMKNWPGIDWMAYFSNIFSPAVKISKDETIYIQDPGYVTNLESRIGSAKKEDAMDYLLSSIIMESSLHIRPNVLAIPDMTPYHVAQQTAARHKYCSKLVTQQFPDIIDVLFELYYADDEAKDNINNMVDSIINQMIKVINQTNWFDDKTSKNLTKKLLDMTTVIGYPDDLKDKEWIERYDGLEINGDHFLDAMLNVTKFKSTVKYNELRKSPRKHETKLIADEITYDLHKNQLKIPMRVLQPPFFHKNLPMSINYGGIGSIIAREITYSAYDILQLSGDNTQSFEVKKSVANIFLEKLKCFIKQYNFLSGQSVVISDVTEKKTIIGDNNAAKFAYLAYKNYLKENDDPILDGFNYSSEKLFWVSFTHKFCTEISWRHPKEVIGIKKYTPPNSHVNMALINNPQFSKSFNCPIESPMNMPHKCHTW